MAFDRRQIAGPSGELAFATDFTSAIQHTTAKRLVEGIAPIEFIWRHWIPCGRVIVVAGAGGIGKSSFLRGLAVARALGLPYFLGIPITQGSTLIVLGEDYKPDVERHLSAWLDFFTEGKPTIKQGEVIARSVHILGVTGAGVRLVDRPRRDYIANEENALGIALLAKELNPRPDLLVCETVSRFGGDESNQAQSRMVEAGEIIAREALTSVALVSHTGKVNARENAFDAYAARGGSSLSDDARGTIVFGRMPSDPKAQKAVIGRTAEPGEKHCFILRLAKATHSPPQDPLILQPRSILNALVLELAEGVPASVLEAERDRRNRLLVNAVTEIIHLGIAPTPRVLRDKKFSHFLPGISYREISDSITDAIEDRALCYSKGSKQILLVGTHLPPAPAPVEQKNGVKVNGLLHETAEWSLTVDFGKGILT